MITLSVEGKKVDIFPAAGSDRPVVYLNTFGHEGEGVHRAMQKMESPDCTLAAISNLEWDRDMTPWYCPPTSKFDTPCNGEADNYLPVLTEKIVPEVEKNIRGKAAWRGIVGYSLAGLFAVYALYKTDLFTRAASMSGSLWYPDLKEYIFSHDMKACPDCVYFSLGDKESKTKNSYMCTVQDNTDEIQKYYAGKGIDSVFVLNPGNHYVNGDKRTAAGIDWILRRKSDD